MSVNKVMIIGNLGADPETKQLDSGVTMTKITVATNSTWKDNDGVKQDKTEWHYVVAFGRLAEIMSEYLVKGRQVYVEGALTTRSWEDEKTKEKRYKTEIKAQRMEFLGGEKMNTVDTATDMMMNTATPTYNFNKLTKLDNEAPTFDKNEDIPF